MTIVVARLHQRSSAPWKQRALASASTRTCPRRAAAMERPEQGAGNRDLWRCPPDRREPLRRENCRSAGVLAMSRARWRPWRGGDDFVLGRIHLPSLGCHAPKRRRYGFLGANAMRRGLRRYRHRAGLPVDGDASFLRVVESQIELNRSTYRPDGPTRHGFARRDRQADVVDRLSSGRVG